MGVAFELISGRVSNPGSTFTALTANTGDSFSVRSYQASTPAYLESVYAHEATIGVLRVRSPRMHDNVQGLRIRVPSTVSRALTPRYARQMLYPQDSLTVEMTGGGAETDVGVLQMYYSDLPGIAARLALWPQIQSRIVNLLSAEVAVTGAATTGDWSAGTALNATFDLLKANVDYAVLGYETDTAVAAIAIKGPDTGNLKVGGPGTTEALETRGWFIRESNDLGTPHIPVINAANKGSTLVHQVSASASATINVSLILAELSAAAGL
jgi:hypothetical protein